MAWNGSSAATSAATNKKIAKPRKASSGAPMSGAFKGTLALILVLAIGAGAYWFTASDEVKAKVIEKLPKRQIAEVEPEIAEKVVEVAEEVKVPDRKLNYWEQPTTNGLTDVQIRKWQLHHNPPSYTNRVTQAKPAYAIFPTHVENEIACLMTLRPGESLVGMKRYSKNLEQEFLKSCEVPIIVTDEDTEYQAQLKRDMIQMKIDLRDRMADGESLEQILTDTRNEAQRLSKVKRELETAMREMIKENAESEADIDACIDAANKMLEDKGIAPIKINPLTKRSLMRSVERNMYR